MNLLLNVECDGRLEEAARVLRCHNGVRHFSLYQLECAVFIIADH
jgi:hypothetical protein